MSEQQLRPARAHDRVALALVVACIVLALTLVAWSETLGRGEPAEDAGRIPAGAAALPSGSPPALAILGTPQVGSVLAAKAGGPSGLDAVRTLSWLRCDPDGADCTPIAGATGSRYRSREADVGHTLRVETGPPVTAESGSASAATPPILPPASAPCHGAPPPADGYEHVVWFWFENKNFTQIIGNARAPFLNSLADECQLLTRYYSLAHYSRRDYIAATGGEIRPPIGTIRPSGYSADAVSIFEQVRSWKVYAESMPYNCSAADTGRYEHGHNPAIFYGRIASQCMESDVPLGNIQAGSLIRDIAEGALPQLSFIVPNGCNIMHEACAKGEVTDDIIARGDAWLRTWMSVLTAGPNYASGSTVVFVTFDEGTASPSTLNERCLRTLSEDCRVATIVVAPQASGRSDSAFYTHYSLLRTAEEIFGARPLGGAADPATNTIQIR